jgi:phage shock protein C
VFRVCALMATSPTLSRTREDRVLAGVVGGIARRFDWNPTVVRALFVIISVVSAAFPGLFVYLLLWMLMPEGEG